MSDGFFKRLTDELAGLFGLPQPISQTVPWLPPPPAPPPPCCPAPDPNVMRDYIDRLTRFYMENPEWVKLAEEARGYIGVGGRYDPVQNVWAWHSPERQAAP